MLSLKCLTKLITLCCSKSFEVLGKTYREINFTYVKFVND